MLEKEAEKLKNEGKVKVYVWPDSSWVKDDDVEDLDLYILSCRKSDDYAIFYMSDELTDEDIESQISDSGFIKHY